MVNGVLAHADETDDSWPGGWHPGCNVVPAALAVGEHFGISGARFVRATALGYDIGARMLITIREGLTATHKATHAVAGVWGAAAAASSAAGLTARQMRWALDYTAQQTSGIGYWYRDTRSHREGVRLRRHAGAQRRDVGVTGPIGLDRRGRRHVGPRQLSAGQHTAGQARAARRATRRALRDRPDEPQALDRGFADPGAARRHGGAAEAARRSIPSGVREILVRSAPESVVDNSDPPDINIQHAMSVMLIDKTVTFRSIHDRPRMQDPAVLRLRAKVRLEAPGSRQRPRTAAAAADHDERRYTVEQDTGPVLGTNENPMTRDQLVAKCRDLMTPVLGDSQSARWWIACSMSIASRTSES